MAETSPAQPEYSDKIDLPLLKIAGVVVLGAVMSILDVTVVSVALPTFQEDFGVGVATAAWTMTAYTLALATVIPVTGWAADRFGTKRLFMMALVLFTVGSLLCAVANSIELLIAFRVVQGLGGGMLMPLGMTIMTRAAGPARIGRLMAVLGVPMMLGPIGGPILGGWLLEVSSWHWIFLINVPLGILTIFLAWKALPADAPEPSEAFDFIGMLLLSPGLALFLYGVSTIPEEGTYKAAKVLIPAAIGLVLIIGFVFWAFKPKHPLLDLRLFRHRNLTVGAIALSVFAVAFMGSGLLFPSYYLQVHGESTLNAGLLLAPQGFGAMLMMPIAGLLADRVPVGRTVPFMMLLMVGGFFAFTQVEADSSYLRLGISLFVMGLGMGGTMMPIMTSAMKALTNHEVARGSTLLNILQQIAGSIGTAVMSVVLANALVKSAVVPGAANPETGEPLTEAQLAIAATMEPDSFPPGSVDPSIVERGISFVADAFASTFTVAWVLMILAIIPALFLPKKRDKSHLLDDEAPMPPIMGH